MKRRDFLKTSATVSALTALGSTALRGADATTPPGREFYELRTYRLRDDAGRPLLSNYLENTVLPALNRAGVKPVGVFTEEAPKDGPAMHLLIPYASLESFHQTTTAVNQAINEGRSSAEYLAAPKGQPAFDRIDSWLLLAFAGLPRLLQPDYSRERKPRIFEIRIYESHSESKALKKVEMFNSGEIDVMKEVGLGPIFFGQALVGANLPHLTYMLSAEDMDSHKAHWAEFGKHPEWVRMKNDSQYADTVSKITNRFLIPTAYSQI